MKKAVIIPDSFKGTLSSSEICGIVSGCIKKEFPDCEVVEIPVADGGEGSVDAFLTAVGGERVSIEAAGPWFERRGAYYGILRGGTAVVEMAAAAGLPLAGERLDPERTTTYGVGELLLDAAHRGAKQIIVGLGGSATNDAGCGAAAAVGARFYNAAGESFIPTGGTLCEVERIDLSGLDPALAHCDISAMCDIDNPMYGPTGAAHVFGAQKGADAAAIERLDAGLRHLAAVIRRDLNLDVAALPGSGAAGGMGAGMVAFFGAKLSPGIDTVLDTVDFDTLAADADMIFTGEGKLDSQSLRGKVVIGIARRAKKLGRPVIAIVGGADYGAEAAFKEGVTAIFPINRLPQDFSLLKEHSAENLAFTAENIMRCLKAAGK